jgi:uncharacterized membrane protein
MISISPVLTGPILGVEVPDSRPVFLTILAIHVLAGLTAVIAGVTAALAPKRAGRHPYAGRTYLIALGTVFITAAGMTALRWPHDIHLLAIGTVALAAALFGWRARRNRRPGWRRRHILGMGSSYLGLLTAFYVDNGPQLPVWNRLPDWSFWILPTAVGAPLIIRALRRYARPASRPSQLAH